MGELLLQHEATFRLSSFVALLLIFALWEALNPKKVRALGRTERWATNITLSVLNSLVLRLIFPVLAVETAIMASENNWGLLNWSPAPFWLEFIVALLMLDLAIYAQHVLTHHWHPLWRLHKVHHADRDVDVTTAIRFHPIEIAFSMALKILLVLMIGPAAAAVIVFEIVLNGTAMFNHANIRLPALVDRTLRAVLVTPDMHRVHHSVVERETNSNYGFNLSLWDRLFGTYRAQPADGHDAMTIGLAPYQGPQPANLVWSLALPFQNDKVPAGSDQTQADKTKAAAPGGTGETS